VRLVNSTVRRRWPGQ